MRDRFISYCPHRTSGEWKGHETTANVRRVIRAAGNRPLRIFALEHTPNVAVFVEIERADWSTYFAEGA